MERSDEASSYSRTVTNADESSACHHRCCDPSSSADVIARGQRCLRRPIRSCSDIQGAGPSLSNDVSQTNRISPSVEVKCWSASSNGVAACTEWSKVNRCGGGASDLTLNESTCSAPQYINPVTPPSDTDSDTQEGDVTSDLRDVSLDNDALNEQSPAPRHRNTFECGRRQSAPGQLGQDDGGSESELQSRRPGLAEYFSSRKQRPMTQNLPGWKLFGKLPPKQSPTKQARIIQQEFEARQVCSSPTHHAAGQQNKKKVEFEPLSTTALILEDRPAYDYFLSLLPESLPVGRLAAIWCPNSVSVCRNLPAKSAEEAQRHRQQHEQMVAAVKRRELKEAQRRRQHKEERLKQEEVLSNTSLVWNLHILPHWDLMRSSRRAQDLWWGGLPPSVRGRVWSLAVGNELNITAELYEIFLSRAKEKWRSLSETDGAACGLELITQDISRTLPSLLVFHKDGPYHDLLQSILGAYTCYRPDVGYVQAMSSIAAMLILNMDEVEVFISFCNLINRPCQLAFYRVDHQRMLRYFGAFQVFFQETLPRLFLHFQFSGVTPDLYLMDWILSLYMKPLPLDVACRVWDVFFRDGEEFLFRTALGILRLYQDLLLHMDLVSIAQFLSRLPDEELLSDRLFACISATPMLSGNRKWTQVLSSGRDLEQSS